MKGIFNLNHPVYQFFRKIFWAIIFNFVFIVTCIPVITIGPSMTGMYAVFLEMCGERQSEGWFTVYFKNFIHHFGKAMLFGIMELVIIGVWAFDFWFFFSIKGVFGIMGCVIACVGAIVTFVVFHTGYAVMVRYDTGWKDTFKETVSLVCESPLAVIGASVWFAFIVAGIFFSVWYYLPFSWMFIMMFGLAIMGSAYMLNEAFGLDPVEEEKGRYSASEIRKYADMSAFIRDKKDEQ